MGSFFAGIKAGTITGVLYVGGMAVFNLIILYALKQDVLSQISSQYAQICTQGGPGNATVYQDCFDSVVSVDVPYIAFVAFFITLAYSGVFGLYYDSVPGGTPAKKGVAIAAIIGANLVFFNYAGFYFDTTSTVATTTFVIAWTVVFGYLLGTRYKKYTRAVQIQSQDAALLKVMVDGRDVTGKTKTYAATSNHKVRAEVADGASFKEWVVTGGLSLEDNRSFETVMEVNGDGTLKGVAIPKY
jgi:hypothetical protein